MHRVQCSQETIEVKTTTGLPVYRRKEIGVKVRVLIRLQIRARITTTIRVPVHHWKNMLALTDTNTDPNPNPNANPISC